MNLRDTNVLIMGMGKSGQAAAKLAIARGARCVACVDSNPNASVVEGTLFHYGPHRLDDFTGGPSGLWNGQQPNLIVLSPGIPPNIPVLDSLIFTFLDLSVFRFTANSPSNPSEEEKPSCY